MINHLSHDNILIIPRSVQIGCGSSYFAFGLLRYLPLRLLASRVVSDTHSFGDQKPECDTQETWTRVTQHSFDFKPTRTLTPQEAKMSILNRKRDLAYLVFFLIHLPVMFCESRSVFVRGSHPLTYTTLQVSISRRYIQSPSSRNSSRTFDISISTPSTINSS